MIIMYAVEATASSGLFISLCAAQFAVPPQPYNPWNVVIDYFNAAELIG